MIYKSHLWLCLPLTVCALWQLWVSVLNTVIYFINEILIKHLTTQLNLLSPISTSNKYIVILFVTLPWHYMLQMVNSNFLAHTEHTLWDVHVDISWPQTPVRMTFGWVFTMGFSCREVAWMSLSWLRRDQFLVPGMMWGEVIRLRPCSWEREIPGPRDGVGQKNALLHILSISY